MSIHSLFKKLSMGLVMIMIIVTPALSSAQTPATGTAVADLCNAYTTSGKVDLTKLLLWPACLINQALIPLLISLMIVLLFWGVIRIVWDGGEKGGEMRAKMFSFLGWAILGLFVMLSIWGIVFAISRTLGIGVGGTGAVPQLYQGQ